jgi:hypothetical protein
MPTARERLTEQASQWYPGKYKDIWSGSQSKRFQSLTDPRRISAEGAMKSLRQADVKELESNRGYEQAKGLERLKQGGAMSLEDVRQTGAMARQRESGRSDLLRQELSNIGAMARQRLSSAPSMFEAEAKYGKGGLESKKLGLQESIAEKEWGRFPGEGYRNRELDIRERESGAKGILESEKNKRSNLYEEYDLYLKENLDSDLGGIREGAPSFEEWRSGRMRKTTPEDYIGSFLSSWSD